MNNNCHPERSEGSLANASLKQVERFFVSLRMTKKWEILNDRGFSTIEALLASTILILIVTAFMGAYIYGSESTALAGQRARATFLAEEGLEASRSIRDSSFVNLSNGNHGIGVSGGVYTFSGTTDTTDIFTRNVTISDLGSNRKQVVSTVNWTQNLQRSGSTVLTTELTDWNHIFGNWGLPSQQSTLDLSGNQAGNKVALSGNYAYVVRNGGTPDFAVIDVSNPASPTLVGSLNLPGIPLNIFVLGNFAYVASTNNTGELQIVNISNPLSPVQVGTDDPTGNGNADGVWVVGTNAYVTRAGNTNNFAIINVSNPASPTQTSIMSLAGPLYEVVVINNFAYVSSGDNSSELQVINVSNPASPSLVGSLNLAGNADAITIAGFQSPATVFLGQNDGTVSIVNVANPFSPAFISSFAAGTSTNDISFGLSDGYLLLATAHSTQEFQVLDISTLSTPTLLGIVNLGNALNGVVYDQVHDRAYIVGTNNSAEFIVIKPL